MCKNLKKEKRFVKCAKNCKMSKNVWYEQEFENEQKFVKWAKICKISKNL